MTIGVRSSIWGKLSTSDVVVFSSWCECSSSFFEGPFKVSLRSAFLSIDQSSVAALFSGKYGSKSQFPLISLHMS